MKKTNFLKITLTLVLAVAFIGVFGQAKEAALTVDNATAHTVTIDKAIPFYVTPDIYYNPNYTAGGGWVVDPASTWTWTFDNGTLTGASMPVGATPAIVVYNTLTRDITFDLVGNYVLAVREESSTCDGSIQLQSITVIDRPDMNFSVADPADNCGDVAAVNVLFNIVANGASTYRVDWTLDVDELSADKLSVIDELDGTGPSTDDLDATTTDQAFAVSGNGLTLTNMAFAVSNNHVTRYTFTLDGINDAVSRVSDYVDFLGRNSAATTFENYASTGDNTYVVTVLPAPATGPIYHLAN